jgi:hypothetical protein
MLQRRPATGTKIIRKDTPMTISQTLQGVLVALVTTVGIAGAVSIAFMAAGAVFKRDQTRVAKARRAGVGPAQHPAHTDQARDLAVR